MSELWWAPARELLPVHPRPGPLVLHPFLRDLLHDLDSEEIQIQPLLSYQGKYPLQVGRTSVQVFLMEAQLSETAPQVQGFTTTDSLSYIPKTHTVKGENLLPHILL